MMCNFLISVVTYLIFFRSPTTTLVNTLGVATLRIDLLDRRNTVGPMRTTKSSDCWLLPSPLLGLTLPPFTHAEFLTQAVLLSLGRFTC